MATISQINGNEVAGKEFYDYVRTVGAVLFSFNPDFSPAALYGGSWEKITDRFLVGAGGSYTLRSTGGEANVTLTVDETPSHDHIPRIFTGEGTSGIWAYDTFISSGTRQTNGDIQITTPPTSISGNNQPHNNMPPYIAVNIWRRVA